MTPSSSDETLHLPPQSQGVAARCARVLSRLGACCPSWCCCAPSHVYANVSSSASPSRKRQRQRQRARAQQLDQDAVYDLDAGDEMDELGVLNGHGGAMRAFTLGDEDEDEEDALLEDELGRILAEVPEDVHPADKEAARALVDAVVGALEKRKAGVGVEEERGVDVEGVLHFDVLKVLFEPIGLRGLERIGQCLRVDVSLRTVELGINDIVLDGGGGGGGGARGGGGGGGVMPHFCAALAENGTLETLMIWGNSLSDVAVAAMAQALRSNFTLRSLGLNNNDMGDRGVEALAEWLSESHTLELLDVSGNSDIRDAGAKALANALRLNKSLVTLKMSTNSVTTAGGLALAAALPHAKTLKRLDLSANLIGDDGVAALVDAVATTASHVDELLLHANIIGIEGVQAAAACRESRRGEPTFLLSIREEDLPDEGA